MMGNGMAQSVPKADHIVHTLPHGQRCAQGLQLANAITVHTTLPA